jgi:hypothetical protein
MAEAIDARAGRLVHGTAMATAEVTRICERYISVDPKINLFETQILRNAILGSDKLFKAARAEYSHTLL